MGDQAYNMYMHNMYMHMLELTLEGQKIWKHLAVGFSSDMVARARATTFLDGWFLIFFCVSP